MNELNIIYLLLYSLEDDEDKGRISMGTVVYKVNACCTELCLFR